MTEPGLHESRAEVGRARLLRASALRLVEEAAAATLAPGTLMNRAGHAAADAALAMMLEKPGPVVVLAGPGNNGGDALVAAALLADRGIDVEVATLIDGSRYRGDAAGAWSHWSTHRDADATRDDPLPLLRDAVLVVDGLFGIGLKRAPDAKAAAWIAAANGAPCPVLALDVPSGLDADTGRAFDACITADRTITFIADKPGLHTADGPDRCGAIAVDALGLGIADPALHALPFGEHAMGAINRPALFARALLPRRRNSHKGSFGSVVVIAGNDGMVGAGLLASRMALMSGTGRVYVRLVGDDAPTFDVLHPELMIRRTLDGVDANAAAIGPGLGHDDRALALLGEWVAKDCSLCLDADALNAIAKDATLMDAVSCRLSRGLPPAVLTPHPLECARLLGIDARDVQADRIAAATSLASRTNSVVVLKGAGTVVADVGGAWVINPTGNAGLATGGTGDVLCGLVAGLLAQHASPVDAARAAVWMHGAAADDLVAAGVGPTGLTASELMPAIRTVVNRLQAPDDAG